MICLAESVEVAFETCVLIPEEYDLIGELVDEKSRHLSAHLAQFIQVVLQDVLGNPKVLAVSSSFVYDVILERLYIILCGELVHRCVTHKTFFGWPINRLLVQPKTEWFEG